MTRRILATLFTLAAWTTATSARADDDALSTELFNAGRDLMKRGDYAAACPKLAESVRLEPSVGALAKLAACEEHEKRLVSARAQWQKALNLARSMGDARAGEVSAELLRLDKLVPKIFFVAPASSVLPTDAVLHVDDLQMGIASLGVPIAVEPGLHAVSVTAPKKKTWSTSVESKPDGATTTVSIPALEPMPDLAEPVPSSVSGAPPDHQALPIRSDAPPVVSARASSTQRYVGAAIAGAGVVALGVGGFFGIQAVRGRGDAGCAGTVCSSDASAATLRDAKSAATASTAFLVVGGALAAAGITWWLVAPSARSNERGSASRARGNERAGVGVSPSFGGVVVSASF
jgi:hypothetical protein